MEQNVKSLFAKALSDLAHKKKPASLNADLIVAKDEICSFLAYFLINDTSQLPLVDKVSNLLNSISEKDIQDWLKSSNRNNSNFSSILFDLDSMPDFVSLQSIISQFGSRDTELAGITQLLEIDICEFEGHMLWPSLCQHLNRLVFRFPQPVLNFLWRLYSNLQPPQTSDVFIINCAFLISDLTNLDGFHAAVVNWCSMIKATLPSDVPINLLTESRCLVYHATTVLCFIVSSSSSSSDIHNTKMTTIMNAFVSFDLIDLNWLDLFINSVGVIDFCRCVIMSGLWNLLQTYSSHNNDEILGMWLVSLSRKIYNLYFGLSDICLEGILSYTPLSNSNSVCENGSELNGKFFVFRPVSSLLLPPSFSVQDWKHEMASMSEKLSHEINLT